MDYMKINTKFFKLTFITTFICLTVSLQLAAQSNARMGVKGGLNVSNLFIDNVDDENARIGFHIGLYGQLFASETFAIQPELLYSTKGSKEQYSSGTLNQEIQYNLNYIDLPVLAVFKLGEQVELHAGGYASYLLNVNVSYEGDLVNGTDEVDKDNLKSYDYGLVGGLGFNFGTGFQIGARYNYGLVKIADSDGAKALIGDARNSNAQIFVAFNFGAQ
jgi:hypothetical protein